MFKLILVVTVISSQVQMPFEHIRSPFHSEKECLSAIEKTRESTVAWFEGQFGPVQAEFECVPAGSAISKDDRAADGIARVFRVMNSQGGFGGGSSPQPGGK